MFRPSSLAGPLSAADCPNRIRSSDTPMVSVASSSGSSGAWESTVVVGGSEPSPPAQPATAAAAVTANQKPQVQSRRGTRRRVI